MTPVKRILPFLFAIVLLGAACGSDSPAESTDAKSTDSAGADSSDAGSSGTDNSGADESTTPEETDGSGDGDGSGVDWPLSFSGGTVDGAEFEAGDYAGQDLVLWFWAPW